MPRAHTATNIGSPTRVPMRARQPRVIPLPCVMELKISDRFNALRFENSFVAKLPADPVLVNRPRQVQNACYTRVDPTPGSAPRLLAWSDETGEMLGLARPSTPDGLAAEVLGGNRVLPGMQPYAARYGGHQFGHWAGQLGDGRAITLGE